MEQSITYMSPLLVSISPHSSVAFARACLGAHSAYSLPCIDGEGCLVGIITVDSLAYAKPDERVLNHMTMCEPISALTPITQAVDSFFNSQFDCLPVTIGKYVVGLLTWQDIESLPFAHWPWCDYSDPYIEVVYPHEHLGCECGDSLENDEQPLPWLRASA